MLPRLIKLWTIVAFCFACVSAAGQHNPYEYYLNSNSAPEGFSGAIFPDAELFYVPLQDGTDLFTEMSEFNFSAVRHSRRGFPAVLHRAYFANINIGAGLSSSRDFSLQSTLRRARVPNVRSAGNTGFVGETSDYYAYIPGMQSINAVSLFASDRRGRAGGRLYSSGGIGDKSSYALMLHGRWGRDASIDGVFTDEVSYLAAVDRTLSRGHKITVFTLGSVSENGLRSSATKEAFELTGDNYYNPSWGYFGGKVRSSRVARRFQPFTVLAYSGELSPATTIAASASYRFGTSSYSALAWFDADTPYPDYYRRMPGYIENPVAAEIAVGYWRDRDPSVTQIDWDGLYGQNLNRGEGAAYIVEERVEDVSDLQAALGATTRFGGKTTVSYGVNVRRDNTLFYKRLRDLLGGSPIEDLDQYLIDDETYGDRTRNDVRNPGRKIDEGDRFGYNYNMDASRCGAYSTVRYEAGRFRASGSLDFGATSMQRKGNYEKELYPGNLSYGRSEKLSFEDYAVRVSGGYSLTPRHIFSLSAIYSALAPQYGSVFVSPMYANRTIGKPSVVGVKSAEGGYIMTLNGFRADVSAFYTRTEGESAVYGYYDDIVSVYSDMILRGVDKEYYGVELAARCDLSPRFSLAAAAALSSYEYASDPVVDILDDATLTPYVSNSATYLKGYRLGASPQALLSVELRYSSLGWLASVAVNHMDGRYVAPNPLRRMERAYNLAGSPERFIDFVRQEMLPAAQTVDVFLLRSFGLGAGRFTAMLAVNNILNKKDIIYSGYEQMRIMRRGSGVNANWRPFDSKYLYSYGRSFYLSVSYGF